MQTFFFVCFGVGVGYTVLSIIFGQIVDFLDFDFDLDLLPSGFLPLKPSIIAAFITVFGGIGLILIGRINLLATLSISTTVAAGIAFFIYRFVITPLFRAQNTSAVEKQSLVGLGAKVAVTIPQGRYGKITYSVNGNIYSSPAKAVDGNEIKHGTDVNIVYIDRNTYYVRIS